MGIVRAGNLKTVGLSNAQIIDGSLQLSNPKNQYFSRTPSSAGNLRTWTLSFWHKTDGNTSISNKTFAAQSGSSIHYLEFASQKIDVGYYTGSHSFNVVTTQVFRDPSAWYHIVLVFDTNNGTSTDRVRIFVNGSRVTNFSTSNFPTSGFDGLINSTNAHALGGATPGTYFATMSAKLSQVYFIDGQALDASYFGFTDPLTNTWRPKKLSSSIAFGTNGFYLPLDGNTPIGQDQSGRGNNWTPVNFGGSNTLEKATGALPILNTDGGGKVARVGVRTDSNASSLVLALPLVGIKSDFSNKINSGTTEKAITANGNATGISTISNFYGGSFDCVGNTSTKCLDIADSADFAFASGDALTLECWIWMDSTYASTPRGVFQSSQQKTGGLSNAWFLSVYTSNQLYWGMHASSVLSTPGSSIPTNVWTHIAICRDTSNNWTAYINGISQTLSGSVSTTLSKSGTGAMVGQWCDGTSTLRPLNGYIQDFRLYKGVAKYTQNFIPASTDPDILPDTPSGVSYSSNVALVPSTDGAVAFDGSGDYLSISSPSSDIINWYSTDYTLEYFIYANAFGSSANGGSNVIGNASTSDGGEYWSFGPKSGGTVTLYYYSLALNSFTTTAALSTGRWYHLALVKNSTSLKIYINGVESASTTLTVSPLSGSELPLLIGKVTNTTEFNGIISNVHIVKGTALYTSNFTPPTAPISSVANTKLLCCKSNSSATATDVIPSGLSITANADAKASNFNPFTVNINTQRGKKSGYCTFNQLASTTTLSNGNLDTTMAASPADYGRGTISMTSGKYYFEATKMSGAEPFVGVTISSSGNSNNYGYHGNGYIYYPGGYVGPYSIIGTGDVIAIAVDATAGSVAFYRNGILVYTFTGITASEYFPFYGGTNSGTALVSWNFGQKPFKFPPPAGFQPLALANTPRPTIVRPDQYVGIVTYVGNGSTQTISGLKFKPDLIIAKSRSTTYYHNVVDSVRGTGKVLYTNTTGADDTNSNVITAFTSDGFSVGSDASANQNGGSMVAWAWKAGGNSNTYNINDIGYSTASAAGLTAGTITPTGASVNTKSGFSIIAYTGNGSSSQSVPHGLGQTPAMIILKGRAGTNADNNWYIWHKGLSSSKNINLNNSTSERGTDVFTSGIIAAPSNTTTFGFTAGSSLLNVNESGTTYITYLWAEIPGFSKFGSYTGNGSTNFVNVGFRPRWIMIKRAVTNSSPDSTNNYSSWTIYDTSRNTYNGQTPNHLYANQSINEGYRGNASDTSSLTDMTVNALSNGFYLSGAGTEINANTGTYIYAAFAETPSFNLYGGQSNAR